MGLRGDVRRGWPRLARESPPRPRPAGGVFGRPRAAPPPGRERRSSSKETDVRRLGAILLASAVSLLSAPPEAAAPGVQGVRGSERPRARRLDGVYWAGLRGRGRAGIRPDGLWRHTVEMDYSFSERWAISVFGISSSKDGSLRYAQARFLVGRRSWTCLRPGARSRFSRGLRFPGKLVPELGGRSRSRMIFE